MCRRFIHHAATALIATAAVPAAAQQMAVSPPMVVVAQPPRMQNELGGGFIEFVFGDHAERSAYAAPPPQYVAPPPAYPQAAPQPLYVNVGPQPDPVLEINRPDLPMDPQFLPREVEYRTSEPPGTIVVDTPDHFLFLVEANGMARRYGIGVGRPGFTWSGEHHVSAKKEWPNWVPPEEMLQRQPYLPRFMAGGPDNPLGARALYLGSTLYRIHGSNEPWTIGHNVSSGCIRMRNTDIIDLYNRVKVGTKVVVM
ncbi:MAG TPA: L,D-transpeptidase [Pseudolabrys sp.]|jgi:lipoprotein-anchoring transpeptidase ErfK/SrfK|uniref:L,D-transpeptidase n=1 Tax=Pseudolabrys sp. TaxID=1960880 RepID=UPI002DDDBD06|nr:L,D-transpeptidase [Pseudolabrys sp.]HEV2628338.1 L,D-transpeptidase [Pseudolabrys sp.]